MAVSSTKASEAPDLAAVVLAATETSMAAMETSMAAMAATETSMAAMAATAAGWASEASDLAAVDLEAVDLAAMAATETSMADMEATDADWATEDSITLATLVCSAVGEVMAMAAIVGMATTNSHFRKTHSMSYGNILTSACFLALFLCENACLYFVGACVFE